MQLSWNSASVTASDPRGVDTPGGGEHDGHEHGVVDQDRDCGRCWLDGDGYNERVCSRCGNAGRIPWSAGNCV